MIDLWGRVIQMDEIDEILANIDKDDVDEEDNLSRDENVDSIPDPFSASGENEKATSTAGVAESDVKNQPPEHGITQTAKHVVPYAVKGTKSWNTKEPYVINIDSELYKKEIKNLELSFVFVDEPLDDLQIREKIKKEIVQYIRKQNDNIISRYTEYIYKHIILVIEDIIKSFKVDESLKPLFLYHIGPLSVYNVIIASMRFEKYGFCYRYLPGNRASRFYPTEFIKEKVLQWYEENINTLNIPCDSLQKYEEIKNMVTRKYQTALTYFNARHKEINDRIGPEKNISRERLFKLKGVDWYGIHSIEIFRRFIGRSIFF